MCEVWGTAPGLTGYCETSKCGSRGAQEPSGLLWVHLQVPNYINVDDTLLSENSPINFNISSLLLEDSVDY